MEPPYLKRLPTTGSSESGKSHRTIYAAKTAMSSVLTASDAHWGRNMPPARMPKNSNAARAT